MSNNSEERRDALFELADDALYVANGGRPFSRLGVIGICAAHISDKKITREDRYEESDEDLIVAIRKRRIKTYKGDPDLLDEHSNNEEGVSLDYQGRFVWELLQNADDAMGSEKRADLIGSKGLGFKSVLEITEKPEIYSGPFHFRFSPDKTRQLLKNEEIATNPPKLIFRIPHDCQPGLKTRELLLNDYATVIRLPFRNQEAHEIARKALADLKPHFLLLSQQLDAVCITGLEQEERWYRAKRERAGLSDGEIALQTPEDSSSWKRWVESEVADDEGKKVTVSIALPVKNGEAVPFDSELPFHVFFPTEESLGVKALVHASFDLEQNRKHLRQGDNDDKILFLFGKLIEKVIRGTPPQTVLETFGSVQCNDNDGKLLKEIKKLILNKMRTTPFVPIIGGGKLPPTETRLWKGGLGTILREDEQAVKDAKLVAPELSKLFPKLEYLGAQYIGDDEHIRLLRYCRNGSQEECIHSFRALAKTGLSWLHQQYGEREKPGLVLLRNVPCWWTDKQTSRSLEAKPKPPLLWKKPDEWPDWLAVDSLHPEFQEEIEKWAKEENSEADNQPWIKLTEDCLSKEKQHYIDWVLIPAIKGWDQQQWEQHGYDVLKWLEVWEKPHSFSDRLPWIKDDNDYRHQDRGNLATSLRLPTNKDWLPAVDCFAGKAWDGPAAFDEFFADREEYGTILPLDKWREDLQKIDKDRWKGLLRWGGVSWEPKVCQTRNFEVADYPPREYYTREDYTHKDDTLLGGKNYLIQDFPDCIENVENKELIQDIFPSLFKLIERNKALRLREGPHGGRRVQETPPSIAYKQLEKEEWLPVKRSLLEDRERIPPKEAFLPGRGLRYLLPEVDRSGIDDRHWFGSADIESRLHKLGVMNELRDDVSQWYKWIKQLAEKSETWPDDPQVPDDWKSGEGNQHRLWRAACSLYREYLEREGSLSSLLEDIKIPCVCLNKEKQRILSFNSPDEVYWINESYLADPTLERKILAENYHLFIFRLNLGKNSKRLGVKELSGVIEVEPCYAHDDEGFIKVLSQLYEKRKGVLGKVFDIELPPFDDLKITAVKNLKLKLSTNDNKLGECPVQSWKDNGSDDILIDVANNKWGAFAHALAYRWDGGKHKQYQSDFELYFSDDHDNFHRRAVDAGVTEEALEPEKGLEEEEEPLPGPADNDTETTEKDGETTDTTGASNTLGVGGGTETAGGGAGTAGGDTETEGGGTGTPGGGTGTPGGGTGTPGSGTETTGGAGTATLHPESGLDAEEWLWKKLDKECSETVADRRTDRLVGTDFILRLNDGREIYIEAKHVETPSGVIHWSKRQYESAKERKEERKSYFIAVLSPGNNSDDSDKYAIHWIWDPLKDLKNLEKREVVWEGKSAPQRLQEGEWGAEETDPREVPTRTFDIKIALENSIYQDENKDDYRLAKLKEKIQSA